MSEYEIGDIVEVTGRSFVGYKGIITNMHEYEKDKFVYLVEIDKEREIIRHDWHLKRVVIDE